MKKRFEYLLLSVVIFIIGLNFISAASMVSFASIPANSSLFYGNQTLSVNFNGSPVNASFGYYSINETTKFLIVQSGTNATLTNITPLAVGNYEINVTINDSNGNINWTRYKVQVNRSNYYDCGVSFNATTGITYPDYFIVSTNCSSAYMLYMNGTPISTATTINAGAAYYNFTVQRNDTANYTAIGDTQFFTVAQKTSVVKTYVNNLEANLASLESGTSIWLNGTLLTGTMTIGDSNGLGLKINLSSQNSSNVSTSVSKYYTGFNTPGYYNVTTEYTGNQNYTAGSKTFYVTVVDTTAPTYSSVSSPNNTEIGEPTLFSINVNDNTALNPNNKYIFSTNDSGVWVNDSGVNFTTTPEVISVVKTMNTTLGKFIGYRWFFNDSSNNMNATTIYVVTTTADITSPSYSGEATETPYYVGRAIAFTITVDDAVALQDSGQYIFSTDNSGTWVNDTAVNFKTTSEVARNVTTLNSTVGKVVSYRWFFSDNVGNTNSTPVYNLTTIYYPGTNNDNGATGGSGGSSTSSPTTYTVDAQFSSGAGNEYNLKVSDKISFPVSSVSHSLTLNKFNSTTAKVTIQSTPIITTLQKGVLYEVDTNGDSVSDVRIRYDGLVGGKAAIFIQEIPVPVVTNPTGEVANNNPSETAGNTNTNTNEGATNTTPVTSNSSKLKWGIIIIAIVIIAIVLIMMLVARKKDKKKRYYSFGY